MKNSLKERRKKLGLTQEQVALQAQTTKATIMKLERGYMQLTASWLERLAVPLQCHPADLLPEFESVLPSRISGVPLLGEIKNRGDAELYRKIKPSQNAAETSHEWEGLDQVEAPPETGYRQLFALLVADDGLEPFLKEGSLIYAAEPKETGLDTYTNQLVLCQTKEKQWLLRRLAKGYEYGKYNLISLQGAISENEEIIAAAGVVFFKPK